MTMERYPIFGIYEKALDNAGFEGMFEQTAKCGYGSFELSLDGTPERLGRLDWSNADIKSVRSAAEQSGVRILSACLSANKLYPLGATDPAVAARGMEIIRRTVDISGELGIRVVQVSGFDVYNGEPRTDQTRMRYVDNLCKCVKYAERSCVMLAIEPVEGNLLAVRDTMEVVRRIDSCWLQIYPDPANICSLGIDPIEEIPHGKGHIAAVHMRDSLPGRFDATIPFGTGQLDFEGVFRALDEVDFVGPVIVEMWNPFNGGTSDIITQARVYMERCIDKVRERHV